MLSNRLLVPRLDAFSVGDYGDTVRVFRLEDGGPFYSEIEDTRKVIRLPNKRRLWNVRDARQWARDKHREIRAGEPNYQPLSAIFASYLEHRSPVKATEQGRKDDKRRAKMWENVLGKNRDPALITKGDLEAFIQRRGYRVIDAWGRQAGMGKPAGTGTESGSPGPVNRVFKLRPAPVRPRTVHADLQWLRGVLRWALSDKCPVPSFKLTDVARQLHQTAEPRRPVATQDRYEAIVKHLSEHPVGYLREIMVLVNGTGHRLSEILSLRWADIDLDAEPYATIRWRADAVGNKARIERVVEVRPDVQAALERMKHTRPGYLFPAPRAKKPKPLHRSVADKWLREAEKAAKLQPLGGSLWHAYRRKWATEKKHLPLVDVAEAGGWKNARTLQTVYQQADPAGVRRVVLDTTELREEKA